MGVLKNPPAFQFYARDWLADLNVRLMTPDQRGYYIDLLCFCWEKDGLPASVVELGRLVGLRPAAAERVLGPVVSRFVEKDGQLRMPRLDDYRVKCDALSERQSKRRLEYLEKRRQEEEANGTGIVEPNNNGGSTVVEPYIADCNLQSATISNSFSQVGKKGAGEKPKPEQEPTEPDKLFNAIAKVLRLDPSVAGNGGKIGKVRKALQEAKQPYTVREVELFGIVFAKQHPYKSVPKWTEMIELIGVSRDAGILRDLKIPGAPAEEKQYLSAPRAESVSREAEDDAIDGEHELQPLQPTNWLQTAMDSDAEDAQRQAESIRRAEERKAREDAEAEALAKENIDALLKELYALPEDKQAKALERYSLKLTQHTSLEGAPDEHQKRVTALRAAMREVNPPRKAKR